MCDLFTREANRDVDTPPDGEEWGPDTPWRKELWWHREFYPPLQEVANDLHARGLLPLGDYVIHVWW